VITLQSYASALLVQLAFFIIGDRIGLIDRILVDRTRIDFINHVEHLLTWWVGLIIGEALLLPSVEDVGYYGVINKYGIFVVFLIVTYFYALLSPVSGEVVADIRSFLGRVRGVSS